MLYILAFFLFILWFWPQNCLLFVLLMSQYPLLDRSQGPKLTKDGAYLTTRGWVGLARPGNPEMPGFFGHSFPEQLVVLAEMFASQNHGAFECIKCSLLLVNFIVVTQLTVKGTWQICPLSSCSVGKWQIKY